MNISTRELELLHSLPSGFKLLRRCFGFRQVDAFLSLTSLVSHGRKVNSPSKRVRRDGSIELFCTLALHVRLIRQNTKVDELTAQFIKIDEIAFVKALTKVSPRWKIFTFDELTHLCALIDEDDDGFISWDDFFLFCRRVEEALHQSKTKNHEETMQLLFEDLSQVVLAEEEEARISRFFEQKLMDVCVSARIKNLHPLTQLYSFVTPDLRGQPLDLELLTHLFTSVGVTLTDEPEYPSTIEQ